MSHFRLAPTLTTTDGQEWMNPVTLVPVVASSEEPKKWVLKVAFPEMLAQDIMVTVLGAA